MCTLFLIPICFVHYESYEFTDTLKVIQSYTTQIAQSATSLQQLNLTVNGTLQCPGGLFISQSAVANMYQVPTIDAQTAANANAAATQAVNNDIQNLLDSKRELLSPATANNVQTTLKQSYKSAIDRVFNTTYMYARFSIIFSLNLFYCDSYICIYRNQLQSNSFQQQSINFTVGKSGQIISGALCSIDQV
jgi:hypothetical protein